MKRKIIKNKRCYVVDYIFILLMALLCYILLKIFFFETRPSERITVGMKMLFPMLFFIYALYFHIRQAVKIIKLPKCIAAEIMDHVIYIYGFHTQKGHYLRHEIRLDDIRKCKVKAIKHRVRFRRRPPACYQITIDTGSDQLVLNSVYRDYEITEDEKMNYPAYKMKLWIAIWRKLHNIVA